MLKKDIVTLEKERQIKENLDLICRKLYVESCNFQRNIGTLVMDIGTEVEDCNKVINDLDNIFESLSKMKKSLSDCHKNYIKTKHDLQNIIKKDFNLEDYEGDYIMHCKSEEDAKIFLRFLDKNGKKWAEGESYTNDNYWEYFKEDTGYMFNIGMFTDVNSAFIDGYKILHFDNFNFENG